MPAWTFYTLAALLALAGVALLIVALYRDTSRGRRRCPRCWYDMSATQGLTCPECGRRARHEGWMYCTRRHRWKAAAGIVLLLGSLALYKAPEIGSTGMAAQIPTRVLIWMYPWLHHLGPEYVEELSRHRMTPDASASQWRRFGLAVLSAAESRELTARRRAVRDIFLIEQGIAFQSAPRALLANRVRTSEIDERRMRRILVRALSDPDPDEADWAVRTLRRFPEAREAAPRLVALLALGSGTTRANAAGTLGAIGDPPRGLLPDRVWEEPLPDRVRMLATLDGDSTLDEIRRLIEPMLGDADGRVRRYALWMLVLAQGDDEGRAAVLHPLLGREANEDMLRPFAVSCLQHLESLEGEFVEALRLALCDGRPEVRQAAVRTALHSTDVLSAVWAEVLAIAGGDGVSLIRREAIDGLARAGLDGTVLAELLVQALRDEDPEVQAIVQGRHISALGPHVERVIPALIHNLQHAALRERHFAAGMLRIAGANDPQLLPLYATIIADETESRALRHVCLQTVRDLGPGAMEIIESVRIAKDSENMAIRQLAIETLAAIEKEQPMPAGADEDP